MYNNILTTSLSSEKSRGRVTSGIAKVISNDQIKHKGKIKIRDVVPLEQALNGKATENQPFFAELISNTNEKHGVTMPLPKVDDLVVYIVITRGIAEVRQFGFSKTAKSTRNSNSQPHQQSNAIIIGYLSSKSTNTIDKNQDYISIKYEDSVVNIHKDYIEIIQKDLDFIMTQNKLYLGNKDTDLYKIFESAKDIKDKLAKASKDINDNGSNVSDAIGGLADAIESINTTPTAPGAPIASPIAIANVPLAKSSMSTYDAKSSTISSDISQIETDLDSLLQEIKKLIHSSKPNTPKE